MEERDSKPAKLMFEGMRVRAVKPVSFLATGRVKHGSTGTVYIAYRDNICYGFAVKWDFLKGGNRLCLLSGNTLPEFLREIKPEKETKND